VSGQSERVRERERESRPEKKKDLIIRAKKEIIRYEPFSKRGLKRKALDITNGAPLATKGRESRRRRAI